MPQLFGVVYQYNLFLHEWETRCQNVK